jgi:uncharacterized protein (TIGR00106 family)
MYGLVEFTVVPIGTGEASVSNYVKKAHEILRKNNLKFEINSMGTVVEGEIPEILNVILEINNLFEELGLSRILTSIKIDYRIDKKSTITGKIKSVTS